MLGNGSINTYPRQRICLQQYKKFLKAVIFMRSVPNLFVYNEATSRVDSP
jgi:hypothetical protein